jgi:hypothetical protein
MNTPRTFRALSRRSALAGLSVGGFGAVLAHKRGASAQETSLAGHPNVGVWMVASSIGPAIAVYADDGSVITALTPTSAGPQGVWYPSTQVGTWESTGERGTHLTAVQLLSDANGAFTGSVTVDAYQTVSDDGQSWTSGEGSSVTIRDAAGATVMVITGDELPPATGIRMSPGNPGFPAGNNATPVS